MNDVAFPCPCCGSADVRRSRRQAFSELPRMALGVFPFRCIACNERFFGNIWLLSNGGFTNCPHCLRLDVVEKVKPENRLHPWDRLCMAMGAHAYRCVPCRKYFVSFRRRMTPHSEEELQQLADGRD